MKSNRRNIEQDQYSKISLLLLSLVLCFMKKTIFWLLTCIVVSLNVLSGSLVFAQSNLEILPKADQTKLWQINSAIQDPNDSRSVWDIYNDEWSGLDTATQVASGVMDWDTILDYGALVLVFLSQAGLLVWALMFIATGYQYVMSVITGDSEPQSDHIKNAITGILVIIFSYAIMRILTRAFLT